MAQYKHQQYGSSVKQNQSTVEPKRGGTLETLSKWASLGPTTTARLGSGSIEFWGGPCDKRISECGEHYTTPAQSKIRTEKDIHSGMRSARYAVG